MSFKLTFTPTEKYYKESYEELLASTKYKKYESYFAYTLAVLGLILYYFDKSKQFGLFPIALSGLGLYELYTIHNNKNKFIKERVSSIANGKQVHLEFNDKTIKHTGPFSNGEMTWDKIQSINKSKKGIIIKPESGINIYLPDHLFEDKSQLEYLFSKKK